MALLTVYSICTSTLFRFPRIYFKQLGWSSVFVHAMWNIFKKNKQTLSKHAVYEARFNCSNVVMKSLWKEACKYKIWRSMRYLSLQTAESAVLRSFNHSFNFTSVLDFIMCIYDTFIALFTTSICSFGFMLWFLRYPASGKQGQWCTRWL